MFLGYQNNKIAFVAETREELENMPCVVLDRIEETSDNYDMYKGEYLLKDVVLENKNREKCLDIREKRNNLLMLTDSKMLSDYPIDDELREQYKIYRQYLRDIPTDVNFPNVDILSFEEWNI